MTRCLQLALFVVAIGSGLAVAEDEKPQFDSPAAVFEAYKRAAAAGDAAAMERCLSEEQRNHALFDSLGRSSGEKSAAILKEHLDEEKRQQLVRERLPITSWGAQQVFVAALRDPSAAYRKLVETWEKPQREYYSTGELMDVAIEGDQATAQVRHGEKAPPVEQRFVKQGNCWLLHTSSEAPRKTKADEIEAKAWTDKAPPSFESPEAVWDAFQKALASADGETAWHCLTDDYRDHLLVESVFLWVADESVLACYLDESKLRPEDGAEEVDGALRAKLILRAIRDPKIYFSAVIKRLCSIERAKGELPEKLRNVSIEGDKAIGNVTQYTYSYESRDGGPPVEKRTPHEAKKHFIKTAAGWKLGG